MKRAIAVGVGLVIVLGLGLVWSQAASRGNQESRHLTIAAAASLTDVLPQLADSFVSANPDASVGLTFAGSAQLVEQVIAGAPIDILITASESTMAKAVRQGAVAEPVVFAANAMAIAVPRGNPGDVRSLADLARPGVTTVVCAPSVPCGAAADALLARNGVDLTPASLELDVRSALGKVLADEADAALVYATDIAAAKGRVESVPIPDGVNALTRYAAAAVKESAQRDLADAFVDFLAGDSAQAILRANGFRSPR